MGFGVGRSNGAISGLILSKMAADSHLGMSALSHVTLASAGLFCITTFTKYRLQTVQNSDVHAVLTDHVQMAS